MSIIRTLLNNGFFILLLIVMVVVYLAYSDSIKQDHGLVVSEKASQPLVEQSDLKQQEIVAEKTEIVVEEVESTVEAEETSNASVENSKVVLKKDLNKSENESVKESSNKNNFEIVLKNSEIDVEKVLSKYNSFSEAIGAARQATSNKEFSKAEDIYYSLVERMPSADVFGEFGDVLYASGKKELAGLAWFEAARMLINKKMYKETLKFANSLKTSSKTTHEKIISEMEVVRKEKQELAIKLRKKNDQKIADYYAALKKEDEAKTLKRQAMIKQQRERIDAYNVELKEYYKKLDAYNKMMRERFLPNQLQRPQQEIK